MEDEYYNDEYEEEEEVIEERSVLLDYVGIIVKWYIRIGLAVGAILLLYYLFTLQLLSFLLFAISLVIAFFFGYFFMYFLDNYLFKEKN